MKCGKSRAIEAAVEVAVAPTPEALAPLGAPAAGAWAAEAGAAGAWAAEAGAAGAWAAEAWAAGAGAVGACAAVLLGGAWCSPSAQAWCALLDG